MSSEQTIAAEVQRIDSDDVELARETKNQEKKKKKKKKEKKSKKEESIASTSKKSDAYPTVIADEKESKSSGTVSAPRENGGEEEKVHNNEEPPVKENDHDDEIHQDCSKTEDYKFDCGNNNHYDSGGHEEDERKVFLSRVPSTFNEDSITRIFSSAFGENCIDEIALSMKREEGIIDNDRREGYIPEKTQKFKRGDDQDTISSHRGFAFITMSSVDLRNEAITKGTIRGTAKEASKKKHTMYIRPLVRSDEGGGGDEIALNVCFLWSKYRCPYGDQCKFKHIGEGGCLQKKIENDPASRLKKQKCFSFRTKGKCKLGDDCPYSHDIKVKDNSNSKECIKVPQDKDCINWKTKGKCRKGDKCPYRHDESIREAFLAKKEKKKKRGRSDNPQPLSVRVFGLNYETKEEDIRDYFQHCGPIREITFPTFEDSGRSKGYCGVLFTSPQATVKATEMDGSSLHGRWLSIQGGKMYLKQWEEREKERVKESSNDVLLGEFGQKVKIRKRHGFNKE